MSVNRINAILLGNNDDINNLQNVNKYNLGSVGIIWYHQTLGNVVFHMTITQHSVQIRLFSFSQERDATKWLADLPR